MAPKMATMSRAAKVSLYSWPRGKPSTVIAGLNQPSTGRNGGMSRGQMPPTTSTTNSRVWMRPIRVGVIDPPLRSRRNLLVPCPAPPTGDRLGHAHLLAEALPGQVVHDAQGRVLQAEERVDAGEVAAEGHGAGGVHGPRLGPDAAHL